MQLEIWFEFASTYSYLTVLRAETLLRRKTVDYVWRPFLLGPIFRSRGLETSPFLLDPAKGAYMWRDVARRAAKHELPFTQPSIFPANGLQAARIMTAALDEPWCGDFAKAVFTAQFAHDADISDAQVLGEAIHISGGDPLHWMAVAKLDTVKADLRRRTAEAEASGIFGAPSFKIGDELFWGDDQLENAVECAIARS